MDEKFDKEKELWNKIYLLREEMVRTAYNKKLDFLDDEVLSLSQALNKLLNEYEKLLHRK
ncbi:MULTISPECIES: aspartyl-phosphate phosphatase Spo0E family protein [Neobacillus]|uniref:Aspartyl-phosphate phosphatase Spo0E family protein n=1 Tax=Neobacillus rhizophilus TaxID=2833579 RepID=A0A942U9K9_9BACI|nr:MULTISPECIES: aspartyl-phosphate phosphatase Spo0E family protein [Neobacillus]MBS4214039.1 aspartyl-phosphate phosphatase Spo0E family protein [Neobacillus rhizophilus]MBU8917558.1 aspartyl-phosphate phosphatase Spo0E family protein [Bacillus sp. FJAT-29953]